MVRVMHPEKGMGVEFTQTTTEHRALLEKFLSRLTESPDTMPELLVEPEGLDTEIGQRSKPAAEPCDGEDPLLGLFRNHAELAVEPFVEMLRKQRRLSATAS